ncbi:MAG TPA: nuclear transport factor 2 family protein [Drouetiella sp.]
MARKISQATLALILGAAFVAPVSSLAAGNVMVQDITEKKDIASTPAAVSASTPPLSLQDNTVTEKVIPNKSTETKSETNYQGWEVDAGNVKISCVNPHAACEESEKVLDTFKVLFKAYSKGDMATAAKYMDDDCTTVDEATGTLITGKKAVIEDMRKKIHEWETSDSPLVEYKMEHPFAKVMGDTAVVSFVAVKIFGGKNPAKYRSHCTDIFKKEDGLWKKLHYRSNWKPVEPASAS